MIFSLFENFYKIQTNVLKIYDIYIVDIQDFWEILEYVIFF